MSHFIRLTAITFFLFWIAKGSFAQLTYNSDGSIRVDGSASITSYDCNECVSKANLKLFDFKKFHHEFWQAKIYQDVDIDRFEVKAHGGISAIVDPCASGNCNPNISTLTSSPFEDPDYDGINGVVVEIYAYDPSKSGDKGELIFGMASFETNDYPGSANPPPSSSFQPLRYWQNEIKYPLLPEGQTYKLSTFESYNMNSNATYLGRYLRYLSIQDEIAEKRSELSATSKQIPVIVDVTVRNSTLNSIFIPGIGEVLGSQVSPSLIKGGFFEIASLSDGKQFGSETLEVDDSGCASGDNGFDCLNVIRNYPYEIHEVQSGYQKEITLPMVSKMAQILSGEKKPYYKIKSNSKVTVLAKSYQQITNSIASSNISVVQIGTDILKVKDLINIDPATQTNEIYTYNEYRVHTSDPFIFFDAEEDGPYLIADDFTIENINKNDHNKKLISYKDFKNSFMIAAHRGYWQDPLIPENHLIAYDSAISLGFDIIEIDVKKSADDVFVLVHDYTPDRLMQWPNPIQNSAAEYQAIVNFFYECPENLTADGLCPTNGNNKPQLKDAMLKDRFGTVLSRNLLLSNGFTLDKLPPNNEEIRLWTIEDAITYSETHDILFSLDHVIDHIHSLHKKILAVDKEDYFFFKGDPNNFWLTAGNLEDRYGVIMQQIAYTPVIYENRSFFSYDADQFWKFQFRLDQLPPAERGAYEQSFNYGRGMPSINELELVKEFDDNMESEGWNIHSVELFMKTTMTELENNYTQNSEGRWLVTPSGVSGETLAGITLQQHSDHEQVRDLYKATKWIGSSPYFPTSCTDQFGNRSCSLSEHFCLDFDYRADLDFTFNYGQARYMITDRPKLTLEYFLINGLSWN